MKTLTLLLLYFIVINDTKHGNIIHVFVFLYYERYSTGFIESGGDAHDLLPTIDSIIHFQHFSIFVTKFTHFSMFKANGGKRYLTV